MCEQVLDGYSVAHERDVLPENRTRRRRELERAIFYEADHGEGCQALRSARQRKACVDLVRDVIAAVRQPVRLHDLDPVATIKTKDTREPRLRGNHVEFKLPNGHRPEVTEHPSVTPSQRPPGCASVQKCRLNMCPGRTR